MKRATLLSTVAATLLLTAGAVSAQQPKQEGAAPAPAAQQNAPAEKVAPAMKPGEHKAGANVKAPAATTGQAPKASDADKTRATAPAMNKSDNDAAKAAPDAKGNADVKGSADVKTKSTASEAKPADKPADKAAQGATTDTKASTTGQGAAAGAAKLSSEQRTKITTVIKRQKVERIEPSKLNISISVGTRIPERGVRFHPLPREVFVIYPEWRGYDYILVGDQIIVVDPRSREIVAILDA